METTKKVRYNNVNKRRQEELKNKKTPLKRCLAMLDAAADEAANAREMFTRSNPMRERFTEITYKIRNCEAIIMEAIRATEKRAIKYKLAMEQADYINSYRRNMAFAFAFAEMMDNPDINRSGIVGAQSKHGRGIGKAKMRTAIPMIMTLVYMELSVVANRHRVAKFMGYRPALVDFVFHSLRRRGFIVRGTLANGKKSSLYVLTDKGKPVAKAAKDILDSHLKSVSGGLNKIIEHYTGGKFSSEEHGGVNEKLSALSETFQEYNKAAEYANSVANEYNNSEQ